MKFQQTKAWKELIEHFQTIKHVHMNKWFANDEKRGEKYWLEVGGLKLDYSKNRIDDKALLLLIELAKQCNVQQKIKAMFDGQRINNTENRAALHVALRNRSNQPIYVDEQDVMYGVNNVIERMGHFSLAIQSGSWLGYTNQVITDVVNIGIGGSDLGALMMSKALARYGCPRLQMYFVSNVDGIQLQSVLKRVRPETTLFIIASKTFSTQETLTNAFTARKWFLEHACDEKFIAKHFVAISTNKEAVQEFGIDIRNMFEFWDWVGGRYSLWSAIGLPIMIYLGKENFIKILEGAHQMDQHFLHTPFEKNMPLILGMLGIWYINCFGSNNHIIAPYDQLLRYFPKFIQQLDMESNGKQVDKDGNLVNYQTGPLVFGDMGINSQHAFFQLLHQGTHISPIDLIVSLKKEGNLPGHHEILLSNVFAQAEAFMKGKDYDEVKKEMKDAGMSDDVIATLAPHRVFSGNRPSNILLLEEITPENLGALVALYEHKIFVQGLIWGINSFDQWGVELGKQLAKTILAELKGEIPIQKHDSSTSHLVWLYRQYNQ